MSTDTLQAEKPPLPNQPEKRPAAKPARRSLFAKSLRFFLWVLLILALLIVLTVGLLYAFAGTDAGFARLGSIASERVPGLSIEGSSGNLRTGISAESVAYTNASIDIKASTLSSGWRLGCLFKRRFCLDNVHIDELDVTTFATEENPTTVERDGPIELPDIQLPLDVVITDVSIGTLRFQPPGDAPAQIINDIQLSAHAENSLVSVDKLSLSYQAFAARIDGSIELQGQYPLDLALNVQSDDVLPDTVAEGEGEQPVNIYMVLSESLTNLDISMRITGLAELQLDATVQPLQQTLPASVDIVSQKLGWPVESHSLIMANDSHISIIGDMNDYEFTVNTNLAGEQVPETGISISGVVNPKRVSLPSIDIDTLGGKASASALAALTSPMVWSTHWKIDDIDPSVQVPELQGTLNAMFNASGMVEDGRWSLKLEKAIVQGQLRELPFRLDAKVSKGLNNLWYVERVALKNDLNSIQAQGFVGEELDINADIELTQLQNFLPGLAGGFNANLVTSGTVKNPDINLQADAQVLRFKDILVQSLAIDGDISQLFTNESSLDVRVDNVRIGENNISNAALSLDGKRSEHQLTLKADGPQETDVDLLISGNLDDTLNWSGLLEKLQAKLPGHDVRLAKPTAVAWQNDTQGASVAPHCWSINESSSLCLQDQLRTDANGQARIALDQYSLQQLNVLLPGETRLAGELAANVALSWGDKGPNDRRAVVSASIDQAQVRTVDGLGEPVNFSYDTIELEANVAPDDAVADLNLTSQTLGNAQIGVNLNPADPQSAITGSVKLQGLLLDIAEAFLPDFDKISGSISADGVLGGTLALPEYDGVVVLDNPVLEAEILPLPITGGQVTARITGQNMNLEGRILSDEGHIDVGGRGRLDPENWEAEVNLSGQQLRIVTDPVQDSTVNHNIRINANPNRISITGDIDIPQATIDVEELPEGAATVSSDIVVIEDEEEQKQAAPVADDSSLDLAVALDVSLGDEVSLSAYGLNANLTGDMDVRIRGNRPPQLGGEIQVVDGIFKKYGQDLVANGQVLFVGPVDGTRLAIDAVREIDNEEIDRTAGLRIQGTVATPEITLFTEPSDKSQDAILSYIILGRDINEASDQEADLLATAALAIAVKGGKSVGGGVAEALGIKEFGLETRGSGDNAELVVSGRINDKLLLRYGRDVFASGSTLYLRYDLTKKLYLEAATAAQGVAQDAVDLFYSFSF